MLPRERVITPYREILDYLNRFTNYERHPHLLSNGTELALERIRYILMRLGTPQSHFDTIHIAGSKGKGSTSTMTAALLSAAGLRVGLFTSPHLHSVRERMAIDGKPITQEAFAETFALLAPILDDLDAGHEFGPATYFEVMTALAFLFFANNAVDLAVLEVGLGGRLDATNIVMPIVTGITPISLDHTRILGNTLELIAGEKAGIFKAGVPVVLAEQSESVSRVFTEKASLLGCRVHQAGSPELKVFTLPQKRGENLITPPPLLSFNTWRGRYENIPQPLIGAHQSKNALLAVGLAECYLEEKKRKEVNTGVIKRAWRALNIPGRMEVVNRKPFIVLDGAHNPASIWVATEAVRDNFRFDSLVVVFGAAADKDTAGMLQILAGCADHLILTSSRHSRSASPEHLEQEAINAGVREYCCLGDIKQAINRAVQLAGRKGLVLVTGSFYVIGIARSEYYPELLD